MTIEDLCHLELTYAPPFGSARDVVNIAGFAATNVQNGLVDVGYAIPDDSSVQLLDVRSVSLAKRYPLAGAVHIPYPVLRDNLDRLDKDKPVMVVCHLGRTSYFAARVLAQNGFQAVSLSGGIKGLGGEAGKKAALCCA